MKTLNDLRIGDRVLRFFHVVEQLPPMPLFVVHITDGRLFCSIAPDVDCHDQHSAMPIWEFDRLTGQEHDPDLIILMGVAGTGYTLSHIEPVP
jgi:hypothetical protein